MEPPADGKGDLDCIGNTLLGINWNNRIIADARLASVHGARSAGGYGRTLLFEVPIPSEPAGPGTSLELLESARRLLASGHYSEVVAKCRMVLEGLTQELNEGPALKAARDAQKQDRTAQERELVMRQAAIDFDRNAAQMMLGTTAALVSSAMSRRRPAV